MLSRIESSLCARFVRCRFRVGFFFQCLGERVACRIRTGWDGEIVGWKDSDVWTELDKVRSKLEHNDVNLRLVKS